MSDYVEAFLRHYVAMGKEWGEKWCDNQLEITFGMQVRENRIARGWTQAELGRRAGLPQATISHIEHGNFNQLGPLKKLARAFDCALIVRFVSHGEAVTRYLKITAGEISLLVPTREQDPLLILKPVPTPTEPQ